jgi:ParB-like nuclease domain/DNA methylase
MRTRLKKSSRSDQFQANRQAPSERDLKRHPPSSTAQNSNVLSDLPWPIQMVAPSQLKKAPRNTRVHPKKQINRIVNSINQFGYTNPALIDDRRNIIGGHARVEAAQRAGLEKIPAIVISGLTEHEKRALALADNRIPELAGWDRAHLARELSELGPLLLEASLDIELTGFEPAHVDALLGDHVDPERDPIDDLPEIACESVSNKGDFWLLGKNRLICGDATNPNDVRKLMGREHAAMVFTDPPYNVKIRNVQGRGRIQHREFLQASGEMSRRRYTRFLAESLSLAAKHSTDGSIHFICIDWRHYRELQDAGEEVYAEMKNLIVWVKTNGGMGTFYRSQHELIFVFKSGQANHLNNFELGQNGRNRTNVWT